MGSGAWSKCRAMTHIGGQEKWLIVDDSLNGNDDSLNHWDGKELEDTYAYVIRWRIKYLPKYIWYARLKQKHQNWYLHWMASCFPSCPPIENTKVIWNLKTWTWVRELSVRLNRTINAHLYKRTFEVFVKKNCKRPGRVTGERRG